MTEQLNYLYEYLSGHLNLALISLSVGVLISIPLGVIASRNKAVEKIALGFAGIVQTVPSIALLAAMVPMLSLVGAKSIGYLPAFIALVLYSLLPVLRNTIVGLKAVDPAYIEAAKGVGMTGWQRLIKVELPLATPMIIAGIRTSAILTVGTATLSTPVGATSLGNYIFVGLQTRNINAILVGCIAAALLAISLDALIRALAYGLEKDKKIFSATAITVFSALYLFTIANIIEEAWPKAHTVITVGAKPFTEQYILAEVLSEKIMATNDAQAKVRHSLSSLPAYEALKNDDIDVFIEYSATIWNYMMKRTDLPKDLASMRREIDEFLDKDGIKLVGNFGFANGYGFAIKKTLAKELNIKNLSDLSRHKNLALAGDYEFFGRPEWRAFQAGYGLEFSQKIPMDHALMYQAVEAKNVDVIVAFTSDGHIEAHDLVLLPDDKGANLPFDAMILMNKKSAQKNENVFKALSLLVDSIDDEKMRGLNFKVDSEGLDPAKVAHDFLLAVQTDLDEEA